MTRLFFWVRKRRNKNLRASSEQDYRGLQEGVLSGRTHFLG